MRTRIRMPQADTDIRRHDPPRQDVRAHWMESLDPTIDLPHSGPLTPHQVLSLQQRIGNRAVQRLLAQRKQASQPAAARKGVVQRNVGFEFEVGTYEVQELVNNMTAQQDSGATLIAPNDLQSGTLHKGKALANQTGFELQVDEGARDFHLEFVTTGAGFPETAAGRGSLDTAMTGMETLGKEINQSRTTPGAQLDLGNQQTQRLIKTDEITGGIATQPETLIRGWGPMRAEPQTTAGIRLEQIPALMENMAAPAGESAKQKQRRSSQRGALASKSNVQDTSALRTAAPDARNAIRNFRQQMRQTQVALPKGFGSENLVGLVALIGTYLKKAQLPVTTYPKSLFPLLGISDFASMFQALPADDQAPFTAVPQRFEDINLDAAGMPGTGGTAFFAGGFAAQLTNMTLLQSQRVAQTLSAIARQDWLSDIPQGTDRLTVAFTNEPALESMGKFNRTEQVGQAHRFRKDTTADAPILELRRMAGRVGVNNWKDLALDVFDFIVELNDKRTKRFESDQYDPLHPK